MSFRRRLGITGITVFVSLAASSVALASTGFSIKAQPQTSFVLPGQNVSVSYTATSPSPTFCDILVEEIAFDATPGGFLLDTMASGSLSTPANTKNGRLTFDLICGGMIVAKDAVNVKVR